VIQKAETDLCISTGLIDDDLFKWRICFQGPEGTPFEGGLYEATLSFPDDFPHMPPKMIFKTEMFHPNSTSRNLSKFTQQVKCAFQSYTLLSKTQ
jgi:ubiquitin-conjugating enzyme E2 G1